jgi:hypothetical protein
MPIDVKKAVELAKGYLSDVLEVPVHLTLLEEIELTEDQQSWLITLSFPALSLAPNPLVAALREREYKVIKLQADTGKLISIKIRPLAAA